MFSSHSILLSRIAYRITALLLCCAAGLGLFAVSSQNYLPAVEPDNTSAAPRDTKNDKSADAQAAKTSWTLFRGDSLGTGVAQSTLTDKPKFLWKYPVHKGAFESTPLILDGVVYIGDLDGHLFALNLADGKEKWMQKTEGGFAAAAAIRDSVLYIGDQDGKFFARELSKGNELWSYSARGQISAPNFYKDCVIFGSRDGNLYCLNAKTGAEVWKYHSEDEIRSCPTVVDGCAFSVGCDSKLHIIDLEKGEKLAAVQLAAQAGSTPAAAGEIIYFGTSAGEFIALNWKKKEVVWNFQDRARMQAISGSAALTSDLVFVPGEDKTLRAFDLKGEEQWKKFFRAPLTGSPVVVGKRVIAAGTDGYIKMFDCRSGDKIWEYNAGGDFNGSPAVAEEKLVIANSDGVVYCFGEK